MFFLVFVSPWWWIHELKHIGKIMRNNKIRRLIPRALRWAYVNYVFVPMYEESQMIAKCRRRESDCSSMSLSSRDNKGLKKCCPYKCLRCVCAQLSAVIWSWTAVALVVDRIVNRRYFFSEFLKSVTDREILEWNVSCYEVNIFAILSIVTNQVNVAVTLWTCIP
jgi:hypothetical protein